MKLKQWEYHIHVGEITLDELNNLGDQGWSLVAVTKVSADNHYYFKMRLMPEVKKAELFTQ